MLALLATSLSHPPPPPFPFAPAYSIFNGADAFNQPLSEWGTRFSSSIGSGGSGNYPTFTDSASFDQKVCWDVDPASDPAYGCEWPSSMTLERYKCRSLLPLPRPTPGSPTSIATLIDIQRDQKGLIFLPSRATCNPTNRLTTHAGNACVAKSASEWLNLGCVVEDPTGTCVGAGCARAGIGSLGSITAVDPSVHAGCSVSCPTNGGQFEVTLEGTYRSRTMLYEAA